MAGEKSIWPIAYRISQKKQDFLCSCYTPLAIRYQLLFPAISYLPFALICCHRLSASSPTLQTRSKSDLPPRFVDDHRHCVGEIEAPVSRNHGDTDTLLF